MIFRSLLIATLLLAARSFAADDTSAPVSAKELLRSRLADEVASRSATPSPPAQTPSSHPKPAPAAPSGGDKNPLLATTAAPAPTPEPSKPKPDAATVLPKVEVKRSRITELDRQLAKEDQEIAREKKYTKPTELDKALNNEKIAKPLAIFGGESDKFRQQVSSERVSLMEDEKDLLEAIAHAKTKEEKAELKKQLDALREERRLLQESMR